MAFRESLLPTTNVSVSTEPSRLEGVKREIRVARERVQLKYVVLVAIVLYFTMYPLRRFSHYFHTTLPDYWPQQYSVPASYATISIKSANGAIETVSLEDLLGRVAPNHGLDLQNVAIQKNDFVNNCDGCIDEPIRLFDLGYKITPDWSMTKYPILSEINMVSIVCFGIALAVSFMFQRNSKLSTVSFLIRTVRIIFTLQVLRPLFHASTGLPGTALHCQHSVVQGGGSSTYLDTDGSVGSFLSALFSISGPSSCGDLMFSGHMVNATTMLVLVLTFAPIAYSSRVAKAAWIVPTVIMFFMQIFLILASRNHYSVDLVASVVITGLFASLDLKMWPEQLRSNEDDITERQLAAGVVKNADIE